MEPEDKGKIILGICSAFIIFLAITFFLQLMPLFFYGLIIFTIMLVIMAPIAKKLKWEKKHGGKPESIKQRYKPKKQSKIKYKAPKIKTKDIEDD